MKLEEVKMIKFLEEIGLTDNGIEELMENKEYEEDGLNALDIFNFLCKDLSKFLRVITYEENAIDNTYLSLILSILESKMYKLVDSFGFIASVTTDYKSKILIHLTDSPVTADNIYPDEHEILTVEFIDKRINNFIDTALSGTPAQFSHVDFENNKIYYKLYKGTDLKISFPTDIEQTMEEILNKYKSFIRNHLNTIYLLSTSNTVISDIDFDYDAGLIIDVKAYDIEEKSKYKNLIYSGKFLRIAYKSIDDLISDLRSGTLNLK